MRSPHRSPASPDHPGGRPGNRIDSRAYVIAALAGLLAAAVVLISHAGLLSPAGPPVETVSTPASPSSATADPQKPGPVGRPTRITVPAIGVDEQLGSVGLDAGGAMELPDYGDAAWYEPGPRPGEPGAAVVVAHVHGPDGPDVFWDLTDLEPGDEVTVAGTAGSRTWQVVEVVDVPKEQLPYERIWMDTKAPLLRLITCGGERATDGSGYPDNTIVYARPA